MQLDANNGKHIKTIPPFGGIIISGGFLVALFGFSFRWTPVAFSGIGLGFSGYVIKNGLQ